MIPSARRLGLTLVVLALLLGVPGAGGPRKGPSNRPVHPLPEEPMVFQGTPGFYGGRMVVSVLGPPKSFNVMVSSETSTNDIMSRLLFEALTGYDNDTQTVTPGLASRWESSPDGLVWTFHLRKGLRWSDGTPLTADDVIFTSRVVLDEKIHPSAADLIRVDGKAPVFEKVDERTIRITLPAPYGPFIHVISSFRVLPRHKLEAAYAAGRFESTWGVDTPPESLVTNGPFVIAAYVPNQTVTLKPNPWYYRIDRKKQRLPYLDELVWVIVPDQNAEVVRFNAGETDAFYVRAEDVKAMRDGQAAGHYTVHDLGTEMGTNMVWFNLNAGADPKGKPFVDPAKLGWFRDARFRRAVACAIDRETIIRNVFYGEAEPLHGPVPAANRVWYNPKIPRTSYDLDRARALLAGAGFRDTDGNGILEDAQCRPVSFRLATNANNRERVATATIIAEDLKKIGLDVSFTPLDFNALIACIQTTFDYDAILLGATGGMPPDPVMMVNSFKSSGRTHYWWPGQASPATPWEARIDSLVDRQLKLNDLAARKQCLDEVQEIYARELPAIYTVSKKGFVAIRDRCRNVRPSVFRPWVVWNAEEIYIDPKAGTPDAAR